MGWGGGGGCVYKAGVTVKCLVLPLNGEERQGATQTSSLSQLTKWGTSGIYRTTPPSHPPIPKNGASMQTPPHTHTPPPPHHSHPVMWTSSPPPPATKPPTCRQLPAAPAACRSGWSAGPGAWLEQAPPAPPSGCSPSSLSAGPPMTHPPPTWVPAPARSLSSGWLWRRPRGGSAGGCRWRSAGLACPAGAASLPCLTPHPAARPPRLAGSRASVADQSFAAVAVGRAGVL